MNPGNNGITIGIMCCVEYVCHGVCFLEAKALAPVVRIKDSIIWKGLW